jgi:hypothetical protein
MGWPLVSRLAAVRLPDSFSLPPQQLQQLGEVDHHPPRLVHLIDCPGRRESGGVAKVKPAVIAVMEIRK